MVPFAFLELLQKLFLLNPGPSPLGGAGFDLGQFALILVGIETIQLFRLHH